MAEVTKPIALDESFNTTESTPRNIADVLAEGLASANTLANLNDVTINTGTLTDKQSLTYNALTGTWVNSTLATPNELNDLSDVTINTPLNKQELLYNDALEVFQNKTTRVELTMAEYNNLVDHDWVLPDVDYYITDAPSMQGTSADLSYDGTTKSVYTKIGEVESGISGLIKTATVSGTTTASGALEIPNTIPYRNVLAAQWNGTGIQKFAFPRGDNYFQVLWNDGEKLTPFVNNDVSFQVTYF